MKIVTLKALILYGLAALLWGMSPIGIAKTFVLPSQGDIVGHVAVVEARAGERLGDIGMRTGTGYYAMQAANPSINPYQHLSGGTRVVIPGQFILPPGPRQGIVINLAEFRLYYYPPGQNIVVTEPIGIGREGVWGTPVGVTKVVDKEKDPAWRPTENVRAEAARQGTPIPDYFPPGPDNPLGNYAIRLGWPAYLIHGTNRPDFIGTRISAGCIRLMPEAIEGLYPLVPIGTTVRIMNQPFKAGWSKGRLYLEAHLPLDEEQHQYKVSLAGVVNVVSQQTQRRPVVVNWTQVRNVAQQTTGIPQIIGG